MGDDVELRRHVDEWLDGIASPNTREAYRRDLHVFVAWLDDTARAHGSLTSADLSHFRTHCEDSGSSDSTVRRRLAAVSSFYRSRGTHDRDNPAVAVARPAREPDDSPVLTTDELDDLWSAASGIGGKTAVLVGLVLFDGFTTRTALRIDIEHVALGRGAVDIAVDGLVLSIDDRTASALRHYLGTRREGPLLLGDRPGVASERLTRFGVDYLVKQAGSRAGIDDTITVTLLRRSVAAAASAAPAPPPTATTDRFAARS